MHFLASAMHREDLPGATIFIRFFIFYFPCFVLEASHTESSRKQGCFPLIAGAKLVNKYEIYLLRRYYA